MHLYHLLQPVLSNHVNIAQKLTRNWKLTWMGQDEQDRHEGMTCVNLIFPVFTGAGRLQVSLSALFQAQAGTNLVEPPMFHELAGQLPHRMDHSP